MKPTTEILAAALTVIAVGTYGIIATIPVYAPGFPSLNDTFPSWIWFILDGALVVVGVWRLLVYLRRRSAS